MYFEHIPPVSDYSSLYHPILCDILCVYMYACLYMHKPEVNVGYLPLFKKDLCVCLFCLCLCICTEFVYIHFVCASCPRRLEEGILALGAGVTGGCMMPHGY